MDFSLVRKNTRHKFLRAELGYKENVWVYYGEPLYCSNYLIIHS